MKYQKSDSFNYLFIYMPLKINFARYYWGIYSIMESDTVVIKLGEATEVSTTSCHSLLVASNPYQLSQTVLSPYNTHKLCVGRIRMRIALNVKSGFS